jgi:hypothetical protein
MVLNGVKAPAGAETGGGENRAVNSGLK